MPVFVTPRNSPLPTHDKKNGNGNNGGKNNGPKTGHQSSCPADLSNGMNTMSNSPNPSFATSNHGNATQNDQNISKSRYQDSSDESKQLYMFLNSVVLQYLEILGLHQTTATFIQESHDEGYPLPPSLSSALDKFPINFDPEQIRPKDVHQLLKYFDEEDTQGLLEKWKFIRNKCSAESRPEEHRLNVHLRIYIYITIPFRQNYSDDDKQVNIQHLIEEFKAKNHDDCNDPEILSLYAIPYVSNPVQHAVFSKFFTTSWVEKLRKNLTTHCQSLCKRLPDPFETDLAKLYRLWSNTNQIMQEFSNLENAWGGSSSARNRNSDNLRLVPSNVQKICKFPEDSPFTTFFNDIIRMKQENLKIKEGDNYIRTECEEKIQLCEALVACLKELYLKDKDGKHISWEGIMQKCSQASLLPESKLSEYYLATDSMMANAPSGQSNFRSETVIRRPPANCDRDNNRFSPRDLNNSHSPRTSQPNTGRQSFRDNNHHGRNASEEPTVRTMRPVLNTTKRNLFDDEGVGDFNRERTTHQKVPPPPPTIYDGRSPRSIPNQNQSPRGLMGMMQSNNMLRNIVRESEYQ